MNYFSTRDRSVNISSADAIKMGISKEGGLFVPESIPTLSTDELKSLVNKSYNDRAKYILAKFLTDFTQEEIDDCVDKAYNDVKFSSKDIAPVKKLNDNAYVLELWHGPTCAFKDMALQILPHLLIKSMKKTNENNDVAILVATSGDTGKAALEGFKDVDNTKILVFYPKNGVSEVQEKQMSSQEGKNVGVMGVIGNFDNCQTGVKKIFCDNEVIEEIKKYNYVFSSANSINWGRLVPQVVYYISAYCDMVKNGDILFGEPINFVVPTGNFGNILAGYIAKKMGLFINKLVCASNKNNVLTEFLETGIYNKNRKFYQTMSPSMDILISSNIERLLSMLETTKGEVKEYMQCLQISGKYAVKPNTFKAIKNNFDCGFTTEKETTKTIKEVYDEFNYVIDPHTAVAFKVYKENISQIKSVVVSTANPYKFPKSVLNAITGEKQEVENEFKLFDLLNEKTGLEIPNSLKTLKEKEVRFNKSCEQSEMKDAVLNFLK